jgi:hypothetical protein
MENQLRHEEDAIDKIIYDDKLQLLQKNSEIAVLQIVFSFVIILV